MGLLMVLREPQPRPVKAKRLTRAQRRARPDPLAGCPMVDVDVDLLLGLVDAVGPGRLQLFGQISPWDDTVLDAADLTRLETDLDLFAAAAATDPAPDRRDVIAALRALATEWRADPSLALHCIGD